MMGAEIAVEVRKKGVYNNSGDGIIACATALWMAYVSALSRDGWLKLQILLQIMIHLKWPLYGPDLSPSLGV